MKIKPVFEIATGHQRMSHPAVFQAGVYPYFNKYYTIASSQTRKNRTVTLKGPNKYGKIN